MRRTCEENYCSCGGTADSVHDFLGVEVIVGQGDVISLLFKLPGILFCRFHPGNVVYFKGYNAKITKDRSMQVLSEALVSLVIDFIEERVSMLSVILSLLMPERRGPRKYPLHQGRCVSTCKHLLHHILTHLDKSNVSI